MASTSAEDELPPHEWQRARDHIQKTLPINDFVKQYWGVTRCLGCRGPWFCWTSAICAFDADRLTWAFGTPPAARSAVTCGFPHADAAADVTSSSCDHISPAVDKGTRTADAARMRGLIGKEFIIRFYHAFGFNFIKEISCMCHL